MTPKQRAVFDAVVAHWAENDQGPTLQDVAQRLGLAVSTVHSHVVKLRAAGVLVYTGRQRLMVHGGRIDRQRAIAAVLDEVRRHGSRTGVSVDRLAARVEIRLRALGPRD
jgi:DNA-binding IclR family transcriptional regulator